MKSFIYTIFILFYLLCSSVRASDQPLLIETSGTTPCRWVDPTLDEAITSILNAFPVRQRVSFGFVRAQNYGYHYPKPAILEQVIQLLSPFRDPARILDAGCGTNPQLLCYLALRKHPVAQYICVDPSLPDKRLIFDRAEDFCAFGTDKNIAQQQLSKIQNALETLPQDVIRVDYECYSPENLQALREHRATWRGASTDEDRKSAVANIDAVEKTSCQGNILKILPGYAEGHFDLIQALHLLHFFDPDQVDVFFQHSARTLKPNGFLVVLTENHFTSQKIDDLYTGLHSYWMLADYKKLATRYGFKLLSAVIVDGDNFQPVPPSFHDDKGQATSTFAIFQKPA